MPHAVAGNHRINPTLVAAVTPLLNHPEDASQAVPQKPPSLLAVTWRENTGQVRDIVVQTYYDPLGGDASILDADGHVPAHLGGELSGAADQFLGLMYQHAVYFGHKDQVRYEQRAFQAALNGDMTLFREQTVDPLRLLVVAPHGDTILPTSLRSRVHGLVLDATLELGTWSGQVGMVTSDGESAEQVAAIVSAWRDMALSLADTFGGQNSGKQIRQALQSSAIQVVSNRVLASASVDSRLAVRASKEIAGRAGSCPPAAPVVRTKWPCATRSTRHTSRRCASPQLPSPPVWRRGTDAARAASSGRSNQHGNKIELRRSHPRWRANPLRRVLHEFGQLPRFRRRERPVPVASANACVPFIPKR